MVKAGGYGGEVWYVQQQNNSLMTEFAELLPDVEPHLPWATGDNSSSFGASNHCRGLHVSSAAAGLNSVEERTGATCAHFKLFLTEDVVNAEALGSAPEAANLWIGTDASVTSFHRDHYENLYCVIRGTKVRTHLLTHRQTASDPPGLGTTYGL